MSRRTVADMQRLADTGWDAGHRYYSPDEFGAHLVRSPFLGSDASTGTCLTHLVRWVSNGYRCHQSNVFETQCGATVSGGEVIAVEDEMFVCARCIATAEKYGEPTFGMVPTRGCEVSGGRRPGRGKARAR